MLKNFLEGKASIEGAEGQGRVLNQIHRDDVARASCTWCWADTAACSTWWTMPP
ncbi:hypothetical protein [Verrucomicrobium spinosum]|uniref:hypothetical protein n=1 Tax=Verrucomicrobium spinosum TaxID=2736 RepID=UPI000AD49DE5